MDWNVIIDAPRELTLMGALVRIAVAILFGGIVGMERGLKNRPAGLRTYMLVCLGSCIVMITNQYVYQVYDSGDPVRMGAQVVSGVGFLGAGTIMVTPHSRIKGLTTAAGLWASACVGLAIGIGFIEVAVLGACAIFIILTVIHLVDNLMRKHAVIIEVYIELDKNTTIGDFIHYARKQNIEIRDIQMEYKYSSVVQTASFVAELGLPKKSRLQNVIRFIQEMDGISYAQVI